MPLDWSSLSKASRDYVPRFPRIKLANFWAFFMQYVPVHKPKFISTLKYNGDIQGLVLILLMHILPSIKPYFRKVLSSSERNLSICPSWGTIPPINILRFTPLGSFRSLFISGVFLNWSKSPAPPDPIFELWMWTFKLTYKKLDSYTILDRILQQNLEKGLFSTVAFYRTSRKSNF